MKILWLNLAETGAARIFCMLSGTIVVLLTARILGPERQGTLSAAIAWVTLFANSAGLSLGQVIHYRIQLEKNKDWFPGIFGGLIFFVLVLSALAYITVFGIYHATRGILFKNISPVLLVFAFSLLPMIIWEQYSSNLLAAVGKLRKYNTAQYVGRGFWVLFTFIFLVTLNWGIKGAIFAQVVGQAILLLIGSVALFKFSPKKLEVQKEEIKEMLKGSAKLHFNTISTILLSQTSILMLNHFAEKAQVGWFQLAYQMVVMMLIIPQAASIVLFSRLSEIGPDRLWQEQKKFICYVLGIVILLSIIAYFIAPIIIPLAVGPEFLPTVKVFRLLLPMILGMSLAQLMTSQWIGRGVLFQTTLATTFGAAVNICANLILIPKYGMYGAVWASLLSYLGIAVFVQSCFALWCEKKYRHSLKLKNNKLLESF